MHEFQYNAYIKTKDNIDDTLDKTSIAAANFVFPGLLKDGKKYADKLDGYYGNDGLVEIKRQLQEYQQIINDKIGNEILNINEEQQSEYNYLMLNNGKIIGDIFQVKYLKYFSIKFYTAMVNLQKLVNNKRKSVMRK